MVFIILLVGLIFRPSETSAVTAEEADVCLLLVSLKNLFVI